VALLTSQVSLIHNKQKMTSPTIIPPTDGRGLTFSGNLRVRY